MTRSEMYRAIREALAHVERCEAGLLSAARCSDRRDRAAAVAETVAKLDEADRLLAAACKALNDATA
jgi:hypothetical protein